MTARVVTFGQPEERTIRQLRTSMADVAVAGVLCADSHPGYSMPIGGVAAYPDHVSPSGVGYDIACGNKAVRTDISVRSFKRETTNWLAPTMDEIVRRISFGIGRVNDEPVDHPVLDDIRNAAYPWQRSLLDLGAAQLGTVGSGNHYVDLLEDEDGWLWVGVHFGSRGFGHRTATHFLERAGRKDDSMDAPPVLFEVDSGIGQAYLEAMRVAGDYAYAGRDLVVAKVLEILGAEATLEVHNHHNYAWFEQHDGQDVWVVRKGATPAKPGQLGFVGGSMGGISVILEGVDSDLSCEALYSTVHGAGRVMGRVEAAGKTKRRKVWQCGNRDCGASVPWFDLRANEPRPTCENCGAGMNAWRREEIVRPGRVDWPAWQERLAEQGVELRGAGPDEAPEVYKDLEQVLGYHAGTIRILHTLRPLGVAMAGPDTIDPYKD